jgi:hypothetical protein
MTVLQYGDYSYNNMDQSMSTLQGGNNIVTDALSRLEKDEEKSFLKQKKVY